MIPPTFDFQGSRTVPVYKIFKKKKKNKRNSEIQTPGIEKLPSMLTKNNFALIYVMVEPYSWKQGGLKLETCPLLQ